MSTHKTVCVVIVQTCKARNNWAKLNAALVLINKRNIQSKHSLSAVVVESMSYLDATPSIEVKLELLNTLKDVCDGKIYVERESAQLHFILSKIYEEQGDTAKACDIIQDVHVETYGTLTKAEKANYILEQIRLNLLRKDYIRAAIHSSKMNRKTLEEPGFAEIKVRFYTMLIEYYLVEKNTWEICQAYYQVISVLFCQYFCNCFEQLSTFLAVKPVETPKPSEAKKDDKKGDKKASADATAKEPEPAAAAAPVAPPVGVEVLESCLIFLLISRFDNHQSDMMHRMKKALSVEYKTTQLNETFSNALSLFTTPEIIPPRFFGQDLIEAHPCLSRIAHFSADTRDYFKSQLRDRVVEHNLRVVSKYYKRIRTQRLSEIMSVPSDALETYLSDISSSGTLFVKIDRPAGIVSFQERKAPEAILSDWASDMSKLMNLMEGTCHLINRENMVHKI